MNVLLKILRSAENLPLVLDWNIDSTIVGLFAENIVLLILTLIVIILVVHHKSQSQRGLTIQRQPIQQSAATLIVTLISIWV